MYIAILGRQPALGMAELESLHGAENTSWFSDISATITTDSFSIDYLGGTQKAGRLIAEFSSGDWHKISMQIVKHYQQAWQQHDGRITLGISAYGFNVSARDVQKTGLILKSKLRQRGLSLRLVPNTESALSSATSHHNKLGLSTNKVELIVVRAKNGRIVIAESIGAQNITAYTRRDQERPKRDAFVGMLPPKLAQIMVNLAAPQSNHPQDVPSNIVGRLLDPFCGTGVVLQEAALMNYRVYGTDLSDKMIDYSKANLEWLARTRHISIDASLHQGDAMTTKWKQPVDAVVCESYLGQPFSAPPSPQKLADVQKNCDHIISSFLKNIASQLRPGTPLCVAVPAWRDAFGHFSHLRVVRQLEQLGYKRHEFHTIKAADLLYFREDQVVARELLVLTKS